MADQGESTEDTAVPRHWEERDRKLEKRRSTRMVVVGRSVKTVLESSARKRDSKRKRKHDVRISPEVL